MALVPIKSVRIRGDEKTNKPGGLDGRLVLNKRDKDRVVVVYLSDTDNQYSNFIATTFTKKDWGEKSDDDVIKAYLNNFPKWKIIQDVFDPVNIPTDPNYVPPSSAGTSGTSGTSGTAGTSGTSGTSGSSGTSGFAETVPEEPINKFITGKVIIKKKSGPGELTGVTEMELQDIENLGTTKAIFEKLQFTEGGDYVLSITCTSDEVEPLELKVKVTKEPDIIEQSESKGNNDENKPVDGSRPIIAQIDKPSIVIPPIRMDQDDSGPGNQENYTEGLGYTPFVWYKAFSIPERDIKYMKLSHAGLVPKIEISFEDTKDIFKGVATPTNESTFELFLNSTSSNLKSLHMVFNIVNFDQGKSNKYTMTGVMFLPSLYVQSNKSYTNTSFGVLRELCKELELGFNSNIKDTDDKMNWVNTNKKPYEFMSDIVSRSYISDESYMAAYIDYYYCFNYVDIEKEMNRDISLDLGLDTSAMSEQNKKDESQRLTKLVLTNDPSRNSSSLFIGQFTKSNESTKKSLKEGYATVTKYYDRIKKMFLEFKVDSTTSDGSKSMILNGSEGDSKYQDENVKVKFNGKMDTDNVHGNYNYAITQNGININKMYNIIIDAKLPNANWNLYKFQKVQIEIINQSQTPTNKSMVDHRYSGAYLIANIEYIWSKGKMSQEVRLIRKELGKTPEEAKNNPPVQAKPEVKENNENPVDTKPLPNSVYVVGQTYLVQDKDGNRYDLLVTKLSEDGKEVTAIAKKSLVTNNVKN